MKNLKILLVFALFFSMVCGVSAQRQRGGDPAKRIEKRMKKMAKHLNLTADQETKVKAILIESAKKGRELKNSGVSRKEKRQKKKALRQETDTKLAAVLSPEQMKKFNEMKQKQKERRKQRGRQRN